MKKNTSTQEKENETSPTEKNTSLDAYNSMVGRIETAISGESFELVLMALRDVEIRVNTELVRALINKPEDVTKPV